MPESEPSHQRQLVLADGKATARLAEELAAIVTAGDMLLLRGELGAGKTTLARALIRALAGYENLEVPSPTFTLVQTYELDRLSVHHVDLYRLSAPEEIDELGLREARDGALVLVEWPERAPDLFAGDRLEIELALDLARPDQRMAKLTGYGAWASRLERMERLGDFLAESGFAHWVRRHLQGDASTRRYERLSTDGRSIVLMDAPPAPDPGMGAVPYSRVAHLAENVVPFVAIAHALRAAGMSAPEIIAADLDAGFLLLEDLGGEAMIDVGGRPILARYEAAVEMLLHLHAQDMPDAPGAAPGRAYRLSHYDAGAFMAEVELLLDWYVPHVSGQRLPSPAEAEFREIWGGLIAPLTETVRSAWVLRDFHSPNLLWLDDRSGVACIGLLDFQDAVIGPAAYDLASLALDARVDVEPELADALLARYVAGRNKADADFDAGEFGVEFATMAAQRNTKILGIFARLAGRDGKPRYLDHLPRIRRYLEWTLAHPALSALRAWHDRNLPLGSRTRNETERI